MSTHQLLEITDEPVVLKESLGDDEPPGQLSTLSLCVPGDLLEDGLEGAHVSVVVPLDGRSRDLQSLLDREVAKSVGDDDVSSFGERGDDRGHRREGLGVDDG